MADAATEIRKLREELQKNNMIRERVDGHHRTLYGEDGRGGLCQDFTQIDTTLKNTSIWLKVGLAIIVPAVISIFVLLIRLSW